MTRAKKEVEGGSDMLRIGKRDFRENGDHVYIMGILNLTPDSFSDGGRFLDYDASMRHTEEMIRDGADIVDLGAESTKPGFLPVSAEEETERLIKVLRAVRKNFDIPISVDTYKAEVMDAAFAEGADLGNDIWGLRYEELHPEAAEHQLLTMAEVAAKYKKPMVLMHNDLLDRSQEARTEEQWTRSGVPRNAREDVVLRVSEGLKRSMETAEEAGIDKDRLILDPGVGFAKTLEENQRVLANLSSFGTLGCGLLLGASRKSVIGDTLHLPPEEREEGTLVTSILAAEAGFCFVRVHDVKKNRRALDFYERIRGM